MGKRLTKKARRFKQKTLQVLQEEGNVALMKFEDNIPYELHICVFFDIIQNKGWPKTDFKYKRIDVTNRVKLIEDAVSDAVGIDDRHNFRVVIEKHCDPDNPGLRIELFPIPEQEVGLTKEQHDAKLRQLEQDRADTSVQGIGSSGGTSRSIEGRPHRTYRRPPKRRRDT
jgi:Holliday junction resolvase RusA-like endonuclease